MNKIAKNCTKILLALALVNSACASGDLASPTPYYAAHLEIGGYYFTNAPHTAGIARAFLPIGIDQVDKLLYIDARGIVKKGGVVREGNLGLGYRYLDESQTNMYGAYLFFDRSRAAVGALFSQFTLGIEHWHYDTFFGGNFYMPVGSRSVTQSSSSSFATFNPTGGSTFNILVTNNTSSSTYLALIGADAMVGYQISEGLAGFIGGYYFTSSSKGIGTKPVVGPLLNLRYIFYPNQNVMIGTFDRITLESQLQYDKIRGTRWYAGARFSLSFGRSNLKGMQRHMVDSALRDIDIVLSPNSTNNTTISIATNPDGQPLTGQIVSDTATCNALIGDANVPVIAVQGVLTNVNPSGKTLATGQSLTGGNLVFTYEGKEYNVTTTNGGELQSPSGVTNLIKVGKDNTISDITLTMVNPANTAIGNVALTTDAAVNDLGSLTIDKVATNGRINITRDGSSQTVLLNITNSTFETPNTWTPNGVVNLGTFAALNNANLTVNVDNCSFIANGIGVGSQVIGADFRATSNGNLIIEQIANSDIRGTDSGLNLVLTGGTITVNGDISGNNIVGGNSGSSESGLLAFGFNASNKALTVIGAIKNNTITSTSNAMRVVDFGGVGSNFNFNGGIIDNSFTSTGNANGMLLSGTSACKVTINGLHNNTFTSALNNIQVNGATTTINVQDGTKGLSAANFNATVGTTGSPTINPGP